MSRLKRIVLLMGREGPWQDYILGVHDYAVNRRPWLLNQVAPTREGLRRILAWKPDGILAHVHSLELLRALRRSRVPFVNSSNDLLPEQLRGVASTGSDNRAIGAMAADHLLNLGLAQFGFLGFSQQGNSLSRETAFRERLQKAGANCSVLNVRNERWLAGAVGGAGEKQIAAWLRRLPKPAGVLACTDQAGLRLSQMCGVLEILVPQQLAILGVYNDEVQCNMAHPPLSSVCLQCRAEGYAAAGLLEKLISGRTIPHEPVLIPPVGIQARLSTDVLAIDDRNISEALRFIRSRALDGISVSDVLKAVPVSRRYLEQKFRALLRRTPRMEIERVRIAEVQRLLSSTSLSVSAIAGRTGFGNSQWLSVVFRKVMRMTPSQFRRRHTFRG